MLATMAVPIITLKHVISGREEGTRLAMNEEEEELIPLRVPAWKGTAGRNAAGIPRSVSLVQPCGRSGQDLRREC